MIRIKVFHTSALYKTHTAKLPRTTTAASTPILAAAPVNSGVEPVAVPDGLVAPYPGMLTMEGLVLLLPASHEGTATAERVTITSAAAAVGQPGCAVMVVVAVALGGVRGRKGRIESRGIEGDVRCCRGDCEGEESELHLGDVCLWECLGYRDVYINERKQ